MKSFSIALAVFLLSTAVARAQTENPYGGPWTEAELRKFCMYKSFNNYKNKNYYNKCMQNNGTIVGAAKNRAALNYFDYIHWYEEAVKNGEDLRTR